jgi:hypothetical protein
METMKIHSGQYKGFDTSGQIQAVIDQYKDLINQHANRVNGAALKSSKMTIQYPWLEQAVREGFEFDERTKEQIDAEEAEEQRIKIEAEYNQKLVAAKTDPALKDKIISDFLTENNFQEWKLPFMRERLILKEITPEEHEEFISGREAKRQEIIDKISNATL